MQQRSSNRLYDNILVLDKDGEPIFKSDKGRVNFYLKNNLAFVVQEEPQIIQLKFEPKGPGRKGDDYYFQSLEIRCVVCGGKDELTHHHIVPYCYRRALHKDIKDDNHYDVVLLCIPCHEKYESEALKYKQELCDKYNVPLNGIDTLNKDKYKASKFAKTLIKYGDNIPDDRKKELFDNLKRWLNINKVPSKEELKDIANMSVHDGDPVPHGELMMKTVNDLFEFVKGWRQHFIDTMQPKYMPNGWTVDGRCIMGRIIEK